MVKVGKGEVKDILDIRRGDKILVATGLDLEVWEEKKVHFSKGVRKTGIFQMIFERPDASQGAITISQNQLPMLSITSIYHHHVLLPDCFSSGTPMKHHRAGASPALAPPSPPGEALCFR